MKNLPVDLTFTKLNDKLNGRFRHIFVAFLGNFFLRGTFKEVYFSPLCMIPRTTDTRWLNPQFFAAQIQISIPKKLAICPKTYLNPKKYLGFGYKSLVFCRNNGCIMENMDKGLTKQKWVLIVWPKIPQMPQNLSAQIVCPSPKVLDFKDLIGIP